MRDSSNSTRINGYLYIIMQQQQQQQQQDMEIDQDLYSRQLYVLGLETLQVFFCCFFPPSFVWTHSLSFSFVKVALKAGYLNLWPIWRRYAMEHLFFFFVSPNSSTLFQASKLPRILSLQDLDPLRYTMYSLLAGWISRRSFISLLST